MIKELPNIIMICRFNHHNLCMLLNEIFSKEYSTVKEDNPN
jgi:hypothetical protein